MWIDVSLKGKFLALQILCRENLAKSSFPNRFKNQTTVAKGEECGFVRR